MKLKFTAEELLKKYEEYKIHRATEFDYRPELIKSGDKAGTIIQVPLPKPQTIDSFLLFAKISIQTFANYSNPDTLLEDDKLTEEDLQERRKVIEVCTRVRAEIRDSQLSGASNGILNERIVARINGLNETVNIKQETKETVTIVNGEEKIDLSM